MRKEIEAKYGKDVYKRVELNREAQEKLGAELLPKVFGFGTTIHALINRQYVENENHFSLYQCIKDIFNPDDIRWIIDATLYNLEEPLAVNGKYFTSEEEIDEHFAGDFMRKASVAFQMAYKNLGEFKDLMPNMTGLTGNINAYLDQLVNSYLNQMEQSLSIYEANEEKEKKTTKKSGKK